jgi:uncharacterized protein (TIRG00374 family)
MINRKTVSTIIQFVVFIGLAAILIVWQMQRMDASQQAEMFDSIRSARPWYIIPVFIVGAFSHYFRALRWRLLLEPLAIYPTRANTFFAVMIGYLVNSFLPRFGEVAKCTVLAKYERVPADKMVGTIVAERAFDVVCLLVIILFSVGLQFGIIGDFAMEEFEKLRAAKGNVLLFAAIGLVVIILAVALLYKRIKKTKIGHIIKGITDGVRSIMLLKRRGLFLLYTVGIWGSYLGMLLLGFACMPATEHLGPLAGLTVLAFGSIGMIITPGGIAAYPPIVAAILELYGINLQQGIAFGWVAWAAQTAVLIILGIIALILLPIYNRNRQHAQRAVDTTEDI